MTARRRRALLTWEQGAGRGHIVAQTRIARHLLAHGVEVVAAVRDVPAFRELADISVRVIQAPPWAEREVFRPGETRSSVTLTDSFAQAGLGDLEVVRRVLGAWRGILDAETPDLVVADYSPLATVAARGRTPIFQHGVGYCLPPSHYARMPHLHALRTPIWREEEVLANLNRALEEMGQAPLTHFGQLFAGDDAFVSTFPLLDPYVDDRERDADGPLITEPVQEVREDAAGIFGYLHLSALTIAHVADGVEKLGSRLTLYAPNLPDHMARRFATAGVEVHLEPLPMAATLARKRLVLHQGSAGVAAEALAAGIPQYTLPTHVENFLNGEALQAAGVGRSVRLFDPAARLDPEHVLHVAHDPDMAMVAAAAGRMHRAMLEENPLSRLVARILALL